MINNSWFKKERPLLGMLGFGGGLAAAAGGEAAPPGHAATGGTINDFTAPDGTIYRTHIFVNSGTFQVTALSPGNPAEVEVLAVGGGGAGGIIFDTSYGGGGGGAGGVVTNAADDPLKVPTPAPISVASYSVTVGGGGLIPSGIGVDGANSPPAGGGSGNPAGKGHNTSAPTLCPIVAQGGGEGISGDPQSYNYTGGTGGSGGGGGGTDPLRGTGNTPPYSPVQGYPGGKTDPNPVYCGGGGGGAGGGGYPGMPGDDATNFGKGGIGRQVAFAGPPTASPIGTPGPAGTGYFGGGGGGSSTYINDPRVGGVGGGGDGGVVSTSPNYPIPATDTMGEQSTGGGGGSWNNKITGMEASPTASEGWGVGGSGLYAIRYEIAASDTQSAKASGGAITFDTTNNKTIHAFTQTGTFAAPPTFSETCEYVVIGGGGGGGSTLQWGSHGAAGGGAGGYRTDSKTVTGPLSMTMTVGAGGGCVVNLNGLNGGPSVINFPAPQGGTYTSLGGGGGGGSNPPHQGNPGGSGGGTTYTGSPLGGGSGTPTQGNPGGYMSPPGGGGGGGGAGGAGNNAITPSDVQLMGAAGGAGIALPTTFINSNVKAQYGSTGPSATYGWVAGGGAGGPGGPSTAYSGPYTGARGGNAPLPTAEPWAGGGSGDGVYGPGDPNYPAYPQYPWNNPRVNGKANTGGGGGGSNGSGYGAPPTIAFNPNMEARAGRGGSGLILIAYPT